ncbi:MAG: diguanylate cyclase [Rhodospirillaceae bacterium]
MNFIPDGPERLIYLIGDDAEEAGALAGQIGHFGYTLRAFTQLGDAREAIRRAPPTALLVDMGFSGGDTVGAESLETLRASVPCPFPVLFLSGRDDLATRLLAVRVGGAGFFPKSVDVPLLVDVLDQLAGHRPPVPERILIVDDDRLQANLNAVYLRRRGMEVKVITDPLTTIEALSDFQPELVLLDMYMPTCTGMELASVMRQIEAFVGLPIVFLSAETDRDKQLAAVGLGGDDFLVKPIKPEHLISAVVSRTERYRKLRSVMMRDGLTGLYNHSTITDRLDQEAARARRQKAPLSVVMIDIDHFKQVNDSHGHPVGDRVIRSLARLLTQRLRQTDIVGRYGGEEFLVVLPDTAEEQALPLVDTLREAFSKLIQHAGGARFSTTCSAGIASAPAWSEAADLKEAADQALYQAKRGGRNRVVAATGRPQP